MATMTSICEVLRCPRCGVQAHVDLGDPRNPSVEFADWQEAYSAGWRPIARAHPIVQCANQEAPLEEWVYRFLCPKCASETNESERASLVQNMGDKWRIAPEDVRPGLGTKERPLVCVVRRCKDLPDEWLAHCLTVDVMTQGGSMQHSLEALGESLELCRKDDEARGLDFYERPPAPDEYWSDVTEVPGAPNATAVKSTQLPGAKLPPHK